jgi:type I restriction enzyme S subunit
MAGKYKTYQKYKDTDDLWCQRVPSHWSIERLRNLGKFSASGIDKKTTIGEPLVKIVNYTDVYNNKSNVLNSDQDYMVVSCDSEKKKVHQIYKGDLLFTPSSETVEDIGVSCLVDEDMVDTSFSYHLIRLQFFQNIFHGYRKYLVNNDLVLNQLSKKARGTTRQTLGRDDFKSILVFLPLYEEQEQIANFLDNETARIDTLIEKQQQLIKLLKEKRQAVISHAATKGLNPDAAMKDSGVEWLGEVPKHWNVSRFKYLISDSAAGPYGSSLTTSMYTSSGIRVYGQQQVIPDDLSIGDYYISKRKFEEMRRYEVSPGELLISVMGTVGRVTVVPEGVERGIINPRLVKYKVMEDKILPHFAKASILSDVSQSQLLFAAQGSTMDGLNMQIIGELPVPYPECLDEQLNILNEIQRKSDKFDKLLKNSYVAVELLKERRTALISAAVTGKIDVRSWQRPKSSAQEVIND